MCDNMKAVLEAVRERIAVAEDKYSNAISEEMKTFWDGQLRCAQALHEDIVALTPENASIEFCPADEDS